MERFISGETRKSSESIRTLFIGLMVDGTHDQQQAERRFQLCADDSRIIISFRTLQGHSGRNLIESDCKTVLQFRADSSNMW